MLTVTGPQIDRRKDAYRRLIDLYEEVADHRMVALLEREMEWFEGYVRLIRTGRAEQLERQGVRSKERKHQPHNLVGEAGLLTKSGG